MPCICYFNLYSEVKNPVPFSPGVEKKENYRLPCDEALTYLRNLEAQNPFEHKITYIVSNNGKAFSTRGSEPLNLAILNIESFKQTGHIKFRQS